MTMQRWDPFRELRNLEDSMDRMWRDVVRPRVASRMFGDGALMTPVDIYETQDHLVVRAGIPGVKPEDVEITVTGQELTIKGHAKEEQEIKEEQYHLRERQYGAFHRTFTLPESVDSDRAEATFEHGELTIRLPKREEVKPKTVRVNVAS